MSQASIRVNAPMLSQHHAALHLAHRWFAFLEAPEGDLDTHLQMFHPQVLLSGSRGIHLFAHDHESLKAWFAAVPDEMSSHHIVHSTYLTANDDSGEGLLNMVVAYQARDDSGVHGSIISYQTRIEFTADGARFITLDKTPILPNTKIEYETSWSTNRVLALVHATLSGITESGGKLQAALGDDVHQVFVHATAPEASSVYEALVTCSSGNPTATQVVLLKLMDDGKATMPTIEQIEVLTLK